MKFLLDTDICINLIRQKLPETLHRLRSCNLGDIGVSTITVAELQYGATRSQRPEQNRQALELFLIPLAFVEFDYEAALAYGRIRTTLETAGLPIGALDQLIAAQAVSRELVLVTNNTREFGRVSGLQIENWTTPV